MSTQSIKQQLTSTGMVRISYPEDVRTQVAKVVEHWKTFCSIPIEIRKRFPYFDGVGYELKEEKGATLDHKEDFHVTLDTAPSLHEFAEQIDPSAVMLVSESQKLILAIAPLIQEFATAVETEFDLPGYCDEVTGKNQNRWWLRQLHYFGDRLIGDAIAAPHVDKSGFTLHLYESDQGLQFLDIVTRTWVDAPVMLDDTVIFPGMQTQYRSNSCNQSAPPSGSGN